MKRVRLVPLLLSLWLAAPLQASSGADLLLARLQPVGSGELTFFGMTVYHATLLAPDGVYHPQRIHALQIDYRFGFSRERLAAASVDEMVKLSSRPLDRQALQQQLTRLLPDVSEGDRLVSLHRPGEGADFYIQDRYLGRLADAAAAADFFAIWLHPQSREPGLRARLLGEQK